MFRKIYYALGIGVSLLYMGGNLISFKTPGTPVMQNLGGIRIERGKYIPPPPPGTTGSGGGGGGYTGSGSGGGSYPSGGGYSGGK